MLGIGIIIDPIIELGGRCGNKMVLIIKDPTSDKIYYVYVPFPSLKKGERKTINVDGYIYILDFDNQRVQQIGAPARVITPGAL